MKTTKQWQYSGDANMLDYGGKNMRCIGSRVYQFVELINMDDACGRDNAGQPKYNVSLRVVDLNAIPENTLQSALECCGQSREDLNDLSLAECCDSYGARAPIQEFSGNNARQLLRQAYKLASEMRGDALSEAMEKTVNTIGSTAAEFMRGDIFSGIKRGAESGKADARNMAKMYGVPQNVIDDTRPADFLPYVMGYMSALNGGTRETDPDTAPEYFRGFERGENVKAGKCPAPGWIQSQATA